MSPRILFVAPRVPYPLENGWNQRMFHLLAALGRLGPVELLCYASPGFVLDENDLAHVRALCERTHILPQPASQWPGGPRTYRDVFERLIVSSRPSLVAEFPGGAIAARAAELAAAADLIWVERIYLAEWLTVGLDKAIVDIDDIESVKEDRQLALQRRGLWQLVLRLDNQKLRRVERRSTGRYARVVVCTDRDRRFFADPGRALVVSNGIPSRLLAEPPLPRDPASLVMVGTMRYAPNVDGARWFAREILPRVRAARPDVRLFLVGDDPNGAIRPLHDGERVIVTGRVADVVPFVSRATLSVVPLRVAGGTRIKILESLALGTPVVSTTIGAEGLDLLPGRHVRLADSPEAFAAAVVKLLDDPAARQALAAAGQELVARRYTWDAVGRAFKGEIEGWLAERGRGAGAARLGLQSA